MAAGGTCGPDGLSAHLNEPFARPLRPGVPTGGRRVTEGEVRLRALRWWLSPLGDVRPVQVAADLARVARCGCDAGEGRHRASGESNSPRLPPAAARNSAPSTASMPGTLRTVPASSCSRTGPRSAVARWATAVGARCARARTSDGPARWRRAAGGGRGDRPVLPSAWSTCWRHGDRRQRRSGGGSGGVCENDTPGSRRRSTVGPQTCACGVTDGVPHAQGGQRL